MLQFIDISKSILLDMEKNHTAVLSMINACVSHEMRNPLNSIIAQNIDKKENYSILASLIEDLKSKRVKKKKFIKESEAVMAKLRTGWKIQHSSANVLMFIV